MKQILLIIALFLSMSVFAQTATIKDVEGNHKGTYTEYITKNNESFKVGDTINLGQPTKGKDFSFVFITGLMGESLEPANIKHSGNRAVVKKIVISFNTVTIKTFKPLTNTANFGFNIPNIEEAIALGEVKSNGMSSEDALSKLKTEKDKLDLGIITKEQYEAKKAELIKYIK